MDYMMLEPFTNGFKGFVSDKQVKKELNLTGLQFKRFVQFSKLYKGCLLIEDESEEKSNRIQEMSQLVCEGRYGRKYYVTTFGNAYTVKDGKRAPLKVVKKGLNTYQVKINGKYKSMSRLMYQAFIGDLKNNEITYFDGGITIKHIKKSSKSEHCRRYANFKKVQVGDKVYNNVQECANDIGYSYWTIQEKLYGRIQNDIGVRYVD